MFKARHGFISQVATAGTVAAGAWVDTFTQALGIDSAAWNGNNMRQYLNESLLSQSGSRVRMTLQSGSGAEGASISSIWMGHAVLGQPDFDGTQVQVTYLGATAFVIPANSQIITDSIVYAFDQTKQFIISCYFDSAANDTIRGANSVTGGTNYFKAGADETSVTDVSSFNSTANAIRMVNRIEVLQP